MTVAGLILLSGLIELFSEIYPKPLSLRKKILDFNEFNETLVDQGEGYRRLPVYLQAMVISVLINSISGHPLLVIYSLIWMTYLYAKNFKTIRMTFTKERVVFRTERIRNKIDIGFALVGLLFFFMSLSEELGSMVLIQNLIIPRIWPALVLYVFALTIPSLTNGLANLSFIFTAITFIWIAAISLQNELNVSQSSYKMTKSVLFVEQKKVGLKTLGVIAPLVLVNLLLNLTGILTGLFIFDFISFLFFPVLLFVVKRYRSDPQFSFTFFNPLGEIILEEVLLDEINFQRIIKAASSLFSFSPHPFGKFPYQIIDTRDFSIFPTGRVPIRKSIVPIGFSIGMGVTLITTVIATVVTIFRGRETLGSVFLGVPLLWAIFLLSLQGIRKITQTILEGERADEIFFDSDIVGYISKRRIWISSILNLEQNDLTNRMPRLLRQRNSVAGDYTNWKLILLYAFFVLIYGVLVQWLRFGALNAEGLYKIGVYYYTLSLQVTIGILLTQPLVMMFLSIIFWLSMLFVLPQILLLARPSLRMEFGKDSFLFHPSDDITSAIFLVKTLLSFKFFTSQKTSIKLRPSVVNLNLNLQLIGSETPVLVKLGEVTLQLDNSSRQIENLTLKVGIFSLTPSLEIRIRVMDTGEETISKLLIDRTKRIKTVQLPNGSTLQIQIMKIIFRE